MKATAELTEGRAGSTGAQHSHESGTRGASVAALACIVVATALRLWNITSAASLNLHIIRQMIGAWAARSLLEPGTPWLQPTLGVAWPPSDPPWRVGLEFPFLPWMTAGLYRVSGEHVWIGSLLSIAFSAAAAWVFYLLAQRFIRSSAASLVALLAFLFLPEAYKYSRLIQPDPMTLFLFLLGMWLTHRWLDGLEDASQSRRPLLVVIALCGSALALAKLSYVPLLLAWAGVVAGRQGLRRLASLDVVLAVGAMLAPAAAFYVWSSSVSEYAQVAMLAGDSLTGALLSTWRDPLFWGALGRWLSAWFFAPGLALVAAGAVALARQERDWRQPAIGYWVAGLAAYFYIAGPGLLAPHSYYFLPALPLGALLIGVAFTLVPNAADSLLSRAAPALAVACAVVLALGSWWMLRGYYTEVAVEMRGWDEAASSIALNTNERDRVIYVTEDWGVTLYLSYVANRQGWTNVPARGTSADDIDADWAMARGATHLWVSSSENGPQYLSEGEEIEIERYVTGVGAAARLVESTDAGALYELAPSKARP